MYLPKPRFQPLFDILMGEGDKTIIIELFVFISHRASLDKVGSEALIRTGDVRV